MKKNNGPFSEEKEMFQMLEKCFPTEEHKLNMNATTLGMSAEMTLFIMQHKDFLKVPIKIMYCMANTAGNMAALTHPNPKGYTPGIMDYSQTDLSYEKKLGEVVKHLYEMCKEEGLIE